MHCTFSLIVKYYLWFWFLLALNTRCYLVYLKWSIFIYIDSDKLG